ncbi:alpha-ketoacid dehydrogenase subunit beta [Candidatus Bathyarchaeota archaeon ex4484_135]|nr:MAG: alpha-ketoacid dehydrogenase subunit beta [Candidatus Bathyarchaeota archaeon ex4484_135]
MLSMAEAINEALREEMHRDERVILLGEDIGVLGGIYRVTKGLLEEFGPERVIDTPISEEGFVGAAIGLAVMGFRPVVEIMYADFLANCMNQIVNFAAKMRYMSGGQLKVPLVIRTMMAHGRGHGGDHSQVPIPWFLNVPGLKLVAPSTPYDAKGLLKSAIRDDSPVIYFEPYILYRTRGPVPEGEYTIPLGKADVKREGNDLTVVAISAMVPRALEAAEKLAEEGISVEVIDPRTIVPLDEEAILRAVMKTNRLLIVEYSHKRGGVGAEIAALVVEKAFDYLDAPIMRLASPDVPIPVSPELGKLTIPTAEDIMAAAKKLVLGEV